MIVAGGFSARRRDPERGRHRRPRQRPSITVAAGALPAAHEDRPSPSCHATPAALVARPARTQPDGTILSVGGQSFQIHYGTNDVTLQLLAPAGFAGPSYSHACDRPGSEASPLQTTGFPTVTISEDLTDTLPGGVTFGRTALRQQPRQGPAAAASISPTSPSPTRPRRINGADVRARRRPDHGKRSSPSTNFGLAQPPSAGQVFDDVDSSTAGNQPGIIGVNAFSTIDAAAAAVGPAGTVVVKNGGTYAESPILSGYRAAGNEDRRQPDAADRRKPPAQPVELAGL